MAKISMSTTVNVSADQLWQVIGGFNALPAWHPAIEKSDSDGETRGAVRKLKIAGGGEVVERLDHVGEDERVYVYSILESPLPVTNYVAGQRRARALIRGRRRGTAAPRCAPRSAGARKTAPSSLARY